MSIALQKYFNPEAIKLAFHRVQCWPDRMVKDQVGIRAFGRDLDVNCERLSEKIIGGGYKPRRGFKYYVPKASLTNRTKTMLFVEDALVFQAIGNSIGTENYDVLKAQESFVFGSVLAPEVKYGTDLLEEQDPNYFFFKNWKGLFNKFKESVIHSIEVDKVQFKFETDITGFFDCIPHYNLLKILSERFHVEDEILDMLSQCLNIWSGTSDSVTPGVGVPQGPLPSSLFANLILHDLDELIIGEGFKYYRYMDDIKIYGYERGELIKALVLIDKYLKGNGLSINSKKTSIESIEDGKEDATVAELKKVQTFTFYENDDEDREPNDLDRLLDELSKIPDASQSKPLTIKDKDLSDSSRLGDQEASLNLFEDPKRKTLKTEKEIVSYWQDQINEVEKALPQMFTSNEQGELVINDGVEDLDFIKWSAQFGASVRYIRALQPTYGPNEKLLKYWLAAYQRFFWRANNFGLTLALYLENSEAKSKLTSLLTSDFQLYEWARYHVLQTLSLAHSFTDKELRNYYFKMLQDEQSDLVKISLYRLLLGHCKSEQFQVSVEKQLQKEKNQYVKIIIADFYNNHGFGEIDIDDFLNSIGL